MLLHDFPQSTKFNCANSKSSNSLASFQIVKVLIGKSSSTNISLPEKFFSEVSCWVGGILKFVTYMRILMFLSNSSIDHF